VLRIRDVFSQIPDPDYCPSRIPEPKTVTKEKGEKKLLSYLFCSHKYNKLKILRTRDKRQERDKRFQGPFKNVSEVNI
jgi:hypothetical protein